jgi:tRNA(His) guanylyltransferase
MIDELGDYFKEKEKEYRQVLLKDRITVMRLDGMRFHSFTRAFLRPYDPFLHYALDGSLLQVLHHELNGYWALAYFQSDEASIILPAIDHEEVTLPFDGRVEKIFGILSQWNTYFDRTITKIYQNALTTVDVDAIKPLYKVTDDIHQLAGKGVIQIHEYIGKILGWLQTHIAGFDCRVFQLDKIDDVPRYLEWRRKDAIRNAKNSLARMFLSPKQMANLSANEVIDLAKERYQLNYESLPVIMKRGSIYHADKFAGWVDDGFMAEDDMSLRFQASIEKMAAAPPLAALWSTRDSPDMEESDIEP